MKENPVNYILFCRCVAKPDIFDHLELVKHGLTNFHLRGYMCSGYGCVQAYVFYLLSNYDVAR